MKEGRTRHPFIGQEHGRIGEGLWDSISLPRQNRRLAALGDKIVFVSDAGR